MIWIIVYSIALLAIGGVIGWWISRKKPQQEVISVDPVLVESMTPPTNAFMLRLTEIMDEKMSDSNLTVEQIVEAMHMGRTTFFHRLKGMTGMSPVEFIRETRMRKAAEMLQQSDAIITEIAHRVGFDDSRYFAKCFKHTYGMTPTEYRGKTKSEE